MSLDCFPLGSRRIFDLQEQPIALDVAYDENLLVTVVDGCRSVIVFDLKQSEDNIISRFKLGEDIVIDKVAYSKTGDYIVAVGHNNGQVGLYVALNWRDVVKDQEAPTAAFTIERLNLNELAEPFDDTDRSEKLVSVDVCQRTGNLAASYGDLVVIYQLDLSRRDEKRLVAESRRSEGVSAQTNSPWSVEDLSDDLDRIALDAHVSHFRHLVSVKLAMWASGIELCENILSIMAIDHVQVIKLEVLTLQIQSDGLDGDGSLLFASQQQVNRSAGSSGESHHQATAMMMAGRQRSGPGAPNAANETTVSGGASASGDESSGSMVSGMTSNQSTRTNFSSFLATDNEELCVENSAAATSSSVVGPVSNQGAGSYLNHDQLEQQLNSATTDSDMTVITVDNVDVLGQRQSQLLEQQKAQLRMEAMLNSQDDCITWNLNTKKLVKLPTLMHNTSTDLSSFHICHPLELLGPASESIACRVGARIYTADLSPNQLEPVVLLCKQFDFDRDPIKLVQLEPVYLATSLDDQKRLSRSPAANVCPAAETSVVGSAAGRDMLELTPPTSGLAGCLQQRTLLKSADHDSLASVCCFVSTHTSCFVYSLTGKKVTRLQTITHPGLCLDLRADLLNVYLLTPLGLQICSTSICDAALRHDWSSSADLNLSFVACDRARVLATRDWLVLVSSSALPRDQPGVAASRATSEKGCQMSSFIEVLQKPPMGELHRRIVQTTQCCQSISIRSNLLTYLQTMAQLELVDLECRLKRTCDLRAASRHGEAISNLRVISLMLARQLLQKKQTNSITNSRIDKTIKHLLDNSFCDLSELMQHAHEEEEQQTKQKLYGNTGLERDRTLTDGDEDENDEELADGNFELLKIFLRHTKFNQPILDYLISLIQPDTDNRQSPTFHKVVSYMSDYNPRLLIKCAQRIARELPVRDPSAEGCFDYLVEQLKQLVKLNSTGINRATVLFTLAILYYEMAQVVPHDGGASRGQHLREQSLASLSQIKPLNHLAITMCSNHEIISRSMARLVNEHHPQVFKLFLNQLQKRDELQAASEFERIVLADRSSSEVAGDERADSEAERLALDYDKQADVRPDEEEELFEQKLRLLTEMAPMELAEFFCRELGTEQDDDADNHHQQSNHSVTQVHPEAVQAYLRASINLMESRFILVRLCENSR